MTHKKSAEMFKSAGRSLEGCWKLLLKLEQPEEKNKACCNMSHNCRLYFQLRVPVELHAAGPVGHWLRDS